MGAALRKGLEFFLGNGKAFIIKNWPTELLQKPTEKQIFVEHRNALTQNARIRIVNLHLNDEVFNELPSPLQVLPHEGPFIDELLLEKKGDSIRLVVDAMRVRFGAKRPSSRFYDEDEGPWIPNEVIVFIQDFFDSLSLATNAGSVAGVDNNAFSHEGGQSSSSTNWQHSTIFQRVWSSIYEWLATFHDISQMITSTTVIINNVSIALEEVHENHHTNYPTHRPVTNAKFLHLSWKKLMLQLVTATYKESKDGGRRDRPSTSKAKVKVKKTKHYYRDVLTAVYMEFHPEKVIDVPAILDKYRGREENMLSKLRTKYALTSAQQDDLYQKHLERLDNSTSSTAALPPSERKVGLRYEVGGFAVARGTWEHEVSPAKGFLFVATETLLSIPTVIASTSTPSTLDGTPSRGGLNQNSVTRRPSPSIVKLREKVLEGGMTPTPKRNSAPTVGSTSTQSTPKKPSPQLSKAAKRDEKLAKSVVLFLRSLSDIRIEVPFVSCAISRDTFPALASTVSFVTGFYGKCRSLHLRELFARSTVHTFDAHTTARWWRHAYQAVRKNLTSKRRRRLRPIVAYVFHLPENEKTSVTGKLSQFLFDYYRLKSSRDHRSHVQTLLTSTKVLDLVLDTTMVLQLSACSEMYFRAYSLLHQSKISRNAELKADKQKPDSAKRVGREKSKSFLRRRSLNPNKEVAVIGRKKARMERAAMHSKKYLDRVHQSSVWTEIQFLRRNAMRRYFVREAKSPTAAGVKPSSSTSKVDLQNQINALAISQTQQLSLTLSIGTCKCAFLQRQLDSEVINAEGSSPSLVPYATAVIVGITIQFEAKATNQAFRLNVRQVDLNADVGRSHPGRHDASLSRIIFSTDSRTMAAHLNHPAFGPLWSDGTFSPPAQNADGTDCFLTLSITTPSQPWKTAGGAVDVEFSLAPFMAVLDLKDMVFLRSLFPSQSTLHSTTSGNLREEIPSPQIGALELRPSWTKNSGNDESSAGASILANGSAQLYELYLRSFSSKWQRTGHSTSTDDMMNARKVVDILDILYRFQSCGRFGEFILRLNPQASGSIMGSSQFSFLNLRVEAEICPGIILIPTQDGPAPVANNLNGIAYPCVAVNTGFFGSAARVNASSHHTDMLFEWSRASIALLLDPMSETAMAQEQGVAAAAVAVADNLGAEIKFHMQSGDDTNVLSPNHLPTLPSLGIDVVLSPIRIDGSIVVWTAVISTLQSISLFEQAMDSANRIRHATQERDTETADNAPKTETQTAHPLKRGIRVPATTENDGESEGHFEAGGNHQRQHVTSQRQTAHDRCVKSTGLPESVVSSLQSHRLCDVALSCSEISVTLRNSEKHEQCANSSAVIVALKDLKAAAAIRPFDYGLTTSIRTCKVLLQTDQSKRASTFDSPQMQASLSAELKLEVQSVSILSPQYARDKNGDVDFRIFLELCGQSVQLSIDPRMIESVAHIFLASKQQVEGAIHAVLFGAPGTSPVAPNSRSTASPSSDDGDVCTPLRKSPAMHDITDSDDPKDSQNYFVFMLDQFRSAVKQYCVWSGGQSMRFAFALRQCDIALPRVTASAFSDLRASQWISVRLKTSANIHCTIYPLDLAASMGLSLHDTEVHVTLLPSTNANPQSRAQEEHRMAQTDADIFQFEVGCEELKFGCCIQLQVHSDNHDQTSDLPSTVSAAAYRTVYISDEQKFGVTFELASVTSSITMENARSLVNIGSVRTSMDVVLNLCDQLAANTASHDLPTTVATAAMKIASKIGVQSIGFTTIVSDVTFNHNELMGRTNHCFPQLLNLRQCKVVINLLRGRRSLPTTNASHMPGRFAKFCGKCSIALSPIDAMVPLDGLHTIAVQVEEAAHFLSLTLYSVMSMIRSIETAVTAPTAKQTVAAEIPDIRKSPRMRPLSNTFSDRNHTHLLTYDIELEVAAGPIAFALKRTLNNDISIRSFITDSKLRARLKVNSNARAMSFHGSLSFFVTAELSCAYEQSHEQILCSLPVELDLVLTLRPRNLEPPEKLDAPKIPNPRQSWTSKVRKRPGVAQTSSLLKASREYFKPHSIDATPLTISLLCRTGRVVFSAGLRTLARLHSMLSQMDSFPESKLLSTDGSGTIAANVASSNVASSNANPLPPSATANNTPTFEVHNSCHRSFDILIESFCRNRDPLDDSNVECDNDCDSKRWSTVPSHFVVQKQNVSAPAAAVKTVRIPAPIFVEHQRTFPGHHQPHDKYVGFRTVGSRLSVGVVSIRVTPSESTSNPSNIATVSIPFSSFTMLRRGDGHDDPIYRACVAWSRLSGEKSPVSEFAPKETVEETRQVLVDILPDAKLIRIHSCMRIQNDLSVPLHFQLLEEASLDGSSAQQGHVWMVHPGTSWEMPTNFLRDGLQSLTLKFTPVLPGLSYEWQQLDILHTLRTGRLWGDQSESTAERKEIEHALDEKAWVACNFNRVPSWGQGRRAKPIACLVNVTQDIVCDPNKLFSASSRTVGMAEHTLLFKPPIEIVNHLPWPIMFLVICDVGGSVDKAPNDGISITASSQVMSQHHVDPFRSCTLEGCVVPIAFRADGTAVLAKDIDQIKRHKSKLSKTSIRAPTVSWRLQVTLISSCSADTAAAMDVFDLSISDISSRTWNDPQNRVLPVATHRTASASRQNAGISAKFYPVLQSSLNSRNTSTIFGGGVPAVVFCSSNVIFDLTLLSDIVCQGVGVEDNPDETGHCVRKILRNDAGTLVLQEEPQDVQLPANPVEPPSNYVGRVHIVPPGVRKVRFAAMGKTHNSAIEDPVAVNVLVGTDVVDIVSLQECSPGGRPWSPFKVLARDASYIHYLVASTMSIDIFEHSYMLLQPRCLLSLWNVPRNFVTTDRSAMKTPPPGQSETSSFEVQWCWCDGDVVPGIPHPTKRSPVLNTALLDFSETVEERFLHQVGGADIFSRSLFQQAEHGKVSSSDSSAAPAQTRKTPIHKGLQSISDGVDSLSKSFLQGMSGVFGPSTEGDSTACDQGKQPAASMSKNQYLWLRCRCVDRECGAHGESSRPSHPKPESSTTHCWSPWVSPSSQFGTLIPLCSFTTVQEHKSTLLDQVKQTSQRRPDEAPPPQLTVTEWAGVTLSAKSTPQQYLRYSTIAFKFDLDGGGCVTVSATDRTHHLEGLYFVENHLSAEWLELFMPCASIKSNSANTTDARGQFFRVGRVDPLATTEFMPWVQFPRVDSVGRDVVGDASSSQQHADSSWGRWFPSQSQSADTPSVDCEPGFVADGIIVLYLHLAACVSTNIDASNPMHSGSEMLFASTESNAGIDKSMSCFLPAAQTRFARVVSPTTPDNTTSRSQSLHGGYICAIRVPVHSRVRQLFSAGSTVAAQTAMTRTVAQLPNGRSILVTVEPGRSSSSPITLRVEPLDAALSSRRQGFTHPVTGLDTKGLQLAKSALHVHQSAMHARLVISHGCQRETVATIGHALQQHSPTTVSLANAPNEDISPKSVYEPLRPGEWLILHDEIQPRSADTKIAVARYLVLHDIEVAVYYIRAHWDKIIGPNNAPQNRAESTVAAMLSKHRHRFNAPGYGRAVQCLADKIASNSESPYVNYNSELHAVVDSVLDWSQLNHTISSIKRSDPGSADAGCFKEDMLSTIVVNLLSVVISMLDIEARWASSDGRRVLIRAIARCGALRFLDYAAILDEVHNLRAPPNSLVRKDEMDIPEPNEQNQDSNRQSGPNISRGSNSAWRWPWSSRDSSSAGPRSERPVQPFNMANPCDFESFLLELGSFVDLLDVSSKDADIRKRKKESLKAATKKAHVGESKIPASFLMTVARIVASDASLRDCGWLFASKTGLGSTRDRDTSVWRALGQKIDATQFFLAELEKLSKKYDAIELNTVDDATGPVDTEEGNIDTEVGFFPTKHWFLQSLSHLQLELDFVCKSVSWSVFSEKSERNPQTQPVLQAHSVDSHTMHVSEESGEENRILNISVLGFRIGAACTVRNSAKSFPTPRNDVFNNESAWTCWRLVFALDDFKVWCPHLPTDKCIVTVTQHYDAHFEEIVAQQPKLASDATADTDRSDNSPFMVLSIVSVSCAHEHLAVFVDVSGNQPNSLSESRDVLSKVDSIVLFPQQTLDTEATALDNMTARHRRHLETTAQNLAQHNSGLPTRQGKRKKKKNKKISSEDADDVPQARTHSTVAVALDKRRLEALLSVLAAVDGTSKSDVQDVSRSARAPPKLIAVAKLVLIAARFLHHGRLATSRGHGSTREPSEPLISFLGRSGSHDVENIISEDDMKQLSSALLGDRSETRSRSSSDGMSSTYIESSAIHRAALEREKQLAARAKAVNEHFEVDVCIGAVNIAIQAIQPIQLLECLQTAGKVDKLKFLKFGLRVVRENVQGQYSFLGFHEHEERVVDSLSGRCRSAVQEKVKRSDRRRARGHNSGPAGDQILPPLESIGSMRASEYMSKRAPIVTAALSTSLFANYGAQQLVKLQQQSVSMAIFASSKPVPKYGDRNRASHFHQLIVGGGGVLRKGSNSSNREIPMYRFTFERTSQFQFLPEFRALFRRHRMLNEWTVFFQCPVQITVAIEAEKSASSFSLVSGILSFLNIGIFIVTKATDFDNFFVDSSESSRLCSGISLWLGEALLPATFAERSKPHLLVKAEMSNTQLETGDVARDLTRVDVHLRSGGPETADSVSVEQRPTTKVNFFFSRRHAPMFEYCCKLRLAQNANLVDEQSNSQRLAATPNRSRILESLNRCEAVLHLQAISRKLQKK